MKINILLLALLLVGCQAKKENDLGHQPAQSTDITLTTVKQGAIASVLTLSASTVYQRKTTLAAPVACYIVQTHINPGDIIKKGQTLFTLESKESRALGNDDMAQNLSIKAVCNGLVTDVSQQMGSYIPEGTPLCTVADLSSMVFELNVPYEQQLSVKKGTACEIVLPDDSHLKASLDKPLLSLDSQSQTGHYIVRAGHPFLPEGLVVQALITRLSGNKGQILPKEAVQCDETMTEFWVMTMSADSVAVKVPVKVGNSNQTEIEIVSPVFKPSDRIICTGSYGLTDGSSVKVVKR